MSELCMPHHIGDVTLSGCRRKSEDQIHGDHKQGGDHRELNRRPGLLITQARQIHSQPFAKCPGERNKENERQKRDRRSDQRPMNSCDICWPETGFDVSLREFQHQHTFINTSYPRVRWSVIIEGIHKGFRFSI